MGSQLVAQVVDGEEEDIVAGLRRRGDNGRRRGNGRGNCCEEPHLKQRPPVQPGPASALIEDMTRKRAKTEGPHAAVPGRGLPVLVPAEERSDYQLKSGATALRLAALSMGL